MVLGRHTSKLKNALAVTTVTILIAKVVIQKIMNMNERW